MVDKAFLSKNICPHSTSYITVSNTIMWMLSGACALIRSYMVALLNICNQTCIFKHFKGCLSYWAGYQYIHEQDFSNK